MLDARKILVNSLVRRVTVSLAAALIAVVPMRAAAHDSPTDVRVSAFVKPDGQRLSLLIRVPMKAMREVDYPRRGAGLLDLARADAALRNAATLWIADNIELYENDTRLEPPRLVEARVSLESDKSFASYEQALAHVTGPRLPGSMELYWEQGLLDVLLDYPIASDRSHFSIRPRLERLGLRTNVVLRFLPPTGVVRAFDLHGDPGLVRLDPRWHQAAWRFVEAGFLHILEGTDHLLFLLCLVIPFRRLGQLALIVTAFTVAHSITLIASAYDMGPGALWFPPLIETLIAISIVYMALENIVGGTSINRRWMIAFGFGLVHGFGFSFALKQTLQFAGSHLLASLLAFNVGVELGQILVLALMIPALEILFRFVVAERIGTIIASALVAHTGWHWMTDRWDRLRQFPVQRPVLDAAFLAATLRWMMLAAIVAGGAWLVFGVL